MALCSIGSRFSLPIAPMPTVLVVVALLAARRRTMSLFPPSHQHFIPFLVLISKLIGGA